MKRHLSTFTLAKMHSVGQLLFRNKYDVNTKMVKAAYKHCIHDSYFIS